MRGGLLLLALAGLLLAVVRPACADDARPASLTIREEEPGRFHLRWQTPVRGTARLRLAPRLPEQATVVDGTYERTLLGDSLVETWRFLLPGGLEGQEVGVVGTALSTRTVVVRVSLRSGSVHRAILAGRRADFVVPEDVLVEKPDLWARAQAATYDGWCLGLDWSHVLFAFLLVLAGGGRGIAWGLGAFFLADLAGRLLPVDRSEPSFGLALVALAAMLAAREAWLGRRQRLVALATLAGLAHGVTTRQVGDVVTTVAGAVGTDGAHLAVGLPALLVLAVPALRGRLLPIVGGVAASALAVSLATLAPQGAVAAPAAALSPMALIADEADAASAQRPTATTQDVEGLDVFLDVAVFETRVEVLARYEALRRWLALPFDDAVIPVEAQPALLERAQAAARERLLVRVDGAPAQPEQVRAAFTTRDATGVYLREIPEPESITAARVGLVLVFPTARIPDTVVVDVAGLPSDVPTRARILDPEVSRDAPLSAAAPTVSWRNELREDPLPPIEALGVRRTPVRVPVLALLVLAAVLAWGRIFFRERVGVRLSLLRAGLFAALLLAPVYAVAVPGLEGTTHAPTDVEQRAITATLLDNLYRAFNERGEDEVYDRLALSLTGDQLSGAYVENRRTLAAQRLGGMRTRVDVVELREFESRATLDDGGFSALVTWTVAGSVTHFGHRHLRRNRYDAVLEVAPVDDAWKIRRFDLRSTERVK